MSNLVTESSDNPRTLWKTLNTILHRKPSNSLPESPDASSLANTFLDFFKDKIERIRTKFVPSDSPDPFLSPPAPPPKLTNFIPATLTEIHKLISASESKQCPLDSIPTFLLKLCFNELGPIITNLVNLSLSEGIFPSSFKQALVQPLLKKPSLSTDDLNNFRPISNLNFISKILEKVVASRIQSHLSSNSLFSSFQSAYRIFHSTETTLLKIHNDLILAMDRGEVTSLILLDLSAAFDTVDHSILLTRLKNWFGLDGLSLNWFTSYLSSRSQAVSINDSISAFSTLSCGVPQGSVLGPLLFTLYTTPLGSVISKNFLKYHLYADDTQLQGWFLDMAKSIFDRTLVKTGNNRQKLEKTRQKPTLFKNPQKYILDIHTKYICTVIVVCRSADCAGATAVLHRTLIYLMILWQQGFDFEWTSECTRVQWHISNDFVRILIATTAAVRLILPNTHKFCFQSVLWPLVALNLMFQNLFLITILLQ